jgi:ABC-type nitrate/sulfonate/bicarbonate transport system substrate-binding protein
MGNLMGNGKKWLLSRPEISGPEALKGKKIATTGIASVATFMLKEILAKRGLDETLKNDRDIIRQVAAVKEAVPPSRAYDFSFALEADRQLNEAGWRP